MSRRLRPCSLCDPEVCSSTIRTFFTLCAQCTDNNSFFCPNLLPTCDLPLFVMLRVAPSFLATLGGALMRASWGRGGAHALDDRQITHLICVRLKHLLHDFLGGVLGLLPVVSLMKKTQTPPYRSDTANLLGGHKLDE